MSKETSYKNISIDYYVYGKGLPVVLLHGFAETHLVWKKQLNFLSQYFMLILPDLPGSGESGLWETGDEKLTIDDLAESMKAVLQDLKIEKCVMLGHSMGGYVTLAFAEKHPENLLAFGLVHSTAFADSDEKKQNRLKGVEMMEDYGSFPFLKTTTPNLFSNGFKKQNPEELNDFVEEGKQFQKENLQQYYFAMMNRPARTEVLKNSKVPVLFVIGKEDVAAPMNDVLKQAYLPEIAYIHIMENSGHMSMLEEPEALNGILRKFLNAIE